MTIPPISFGDNVLIATTAETERLGLAGLTGDVRGESTPSATGIEVIGDVTDDFAINVYVEDRETDYWFSPELLQFVDHGAGTVFMIDGVGKKWTRNVDGSWKESADLATKKRRIILMLLAYSLIAGIIVCFLPEEETVLEFIFGLPFLILGIAWCYIDAWERDYRLGRLMQITLVLLFAIGLPVYIFRTRGVGGFRTMANLLLLTGAMVVCLVTAELVTW